MMCTCICSHSAATSAHVALYLYIFFIQLLIAYCWFFLILSSTNIPFVSISTLQNDGSFNITESQKALYYDPTITNEHLS